MPQSDEIDVVGTYASILAASEVGLGSLLHAFYIPLSGHFLSLNQLFCLNCALVHLPETKHAPTWISLIAAAFKTFSPFGKRITPMLAISMQGALFNMGCIVLKGTPGRLLGAFLLSLWGMLQPLLIYALIFGIKIWEINQSVCAFFHLHDTFFIGLYLILLLVKIGIALSIVVVTPRLPFTFFDRYFAFLMKFKPQKKISGAPLFWTVLCKDMANPTFLTLLTCACGLAYFKDSNWIYQGFRTLAIAFAVFYLLRICPMQKIVKAFKRFPTFSRGLEIALQKFSNISTESPTRK